MKTLGEKIRLQRRSMALAASLLLVVILLVIGIGLLGLGWNTRISAVKDSAGIVARAASDAGLTKAIYEMNEKLKLKPWNDSTLPKTIDHVLPNCEAIFSYDTIIDANGVYSIESTGDCGRGTKKIGCTLRLRGLFEHAILARDKISLMPNTLVTGYNSSDSSITDVEAPIGTLSIADNSILLGPGTVVEGDVYVGVGGDPDSVVGSGTTTGEKLAFTKEPFFPVITPPALPSMGNLTAKGKTIKIGPADSGEYGTINLSKQAAKSGVLEIDGGDVTLYVTGDIDMAQDCEINLMGSSTLTLYIDGDIDCDNNSGISNATGCPGNFRLYATGTGLQTFDIKAKSDVLGAIYAPNADVTIYAAGDFYGAVITNTFDLKSSSVVNYDEDLKSVTVNDIGVFFVMDRWWEK